MNLFKAAIQPVSCCTSRVVFGEGISKNAQLCLGPALIPHSVTRYLRNSPEGSPKVLFALLSFIPYLLRITKHSRSCYTWSVIFSNFSSMSSI